MQNSRLDHLVVAALDLEQGADYIEALLGVRVPDGGRHLFMGTHNKVMSLGNNTYLELVAVCPEIDPPQKPRWFGLDDPAVIASLARGPRLINWAINTDRLDELVAASAINVGEIQHAERDDLRWQVALTDDGRLPAAGCVPLCIQWMMDFHPSSRMLDAGCRLKKFEISHPYPGWLKNCLGSIGAEDLVKIVKSGSVRIQALLDTPSGEAILDSAVAK